MGRPGRTNRAQILTEALALADERGLDALTMAGVAQRLDVTPMALYRHVNRKSDLLDGLVELLVEEIVVADVPSAWPERLRAFAGSMRATAQRHPAAFPLLLTRPATTTRARERRHAITLALIESGVPDADAEQLQRLLTTAILGFAMSEVAGRFAALSLAERDADFTSLLDLLVEAIRSRQTVGEVPATEPS